MQNASDPFAEFAVASDNDPFAEFAVKPEASPAESFVRGGAQGASMGFADEATGALGVVKNLKNIAFGSDTVKDTYKKERDESRAAYKAAEAANPYSYLVGQVGGAGASSFVPVTGLASLAAKGALSGAGYSSAEDSVGVAKDSAIGGVLGGVAGAMAGTVGIAAKLASGKLSALAELVKASSSAAVKSTIGELATKAAAAGVSQTLIDKIVSAANK